MKKLILILFMLMVGSVAASETPDVEPVWEKVQVLSSEANGEVTSLWRGKAVTHDIVDGLAVVEGDIILGVIDVDATGAVEEVDGDENSKGGKKHAVGITGSRYRWPSGVMPYVISSTFDSARRARIQAAIDHWNYIMAGVVRLVPRTNQYAYVQFANTTSNTCSSSIGMTGYVQSIQFGPYCSIGNGIHEIGHAFGLFHEQVREDRDRYVRINWGNIQYGKESNFTQKISTSDDLGEYDYGSIMHYDRYAFSKNGLPTIETLNGAYIGQRSGLSAKDIAAIRFMYGR